MGMPNFENRTIFHGDNLEFLRGLNSESVDLIATDPPFNKSKDFHATPDRLAAGASFTDRWRWEHDVQQEWVDALTDDWRPVMDFINGVKASGSADMAAFLCWLGVRLLECRRILKPTGSLYLHIDHTAHAYAKVLLDGIFGRENFRNEIVWKRTNAPTASDYQLGCVHDTLLFYAKSDLVTVNPVFIPYTDAYVKQNYRFKDSRGPFQPTPLTAKGTTKGSSGQAWRGIDITAKGLHWVVPKAIPSGVAYPAGFAGMSSLEKLDWLDHEDLIYWPPKGNMPRFKRYLTTSDGTRASDLVVDIAGVQGASKENSGYPTQKPLALYERIIMASSNEGDVVLDPHCGCATTPIAAERLGRQWIGMDIWKCAYQMVLDRLNAEKQIWKPEDVRLITRPPERTDAGETAAPYLPQLQGKVAKPPRFSRDQMKAILIRQWSAVCWGCGFEPPNGDDRFFDLDHDRPKAGGGSNELDNRAILCRPCNGRKSNTLTLEGLRRANKRDGYWYGSPPIDQRIPLKLAVAWAQEYLAQAGQQAVLPDSAD